MKVLIPIEDHIYGDALIEFAVEHKWTTNPQFKILHVVEPAQYTLPNIALWADIEADVNEQRLNSGQALVKSLAQKLRKAIPEATVDEIVVPGIVRQEIMEIIRSWQPDLVVVGAHAKPKPAIIGLGSISFAILLAAPCSVVVVRLTPTEKKPGQEKQLAATNLQSG